jgi:hypothetical protein
MLRERVVLERGWRTNVFQIIVNRRDKIDDLLARGRLGAPRRERIFEEVHRRVRGGPVARSKVLVIAGPLALAAGLLLLLRPEGGAPGAYAPKGSSSAQVEVSCSGGELSHCPHGSKLIFRLDALAASGFLHAFAEPQEKGQERVWYYPTAVNAPPRLEPAAEGQILDRAIVVGMEHAPGRYRVHIVVASRSLSREELLRAEAPDVVATNIVELVIVDP